MPLRILLALLLLAFAPRASFASAPRVSSCAPTADCPIQYYAGGVAGIGQYYWAGEVFTTSFAGKLMEIELGLSSTSADEVFCQLRTVSGGLPTTTVIAEAEVPGAPYQQTPYLADFSAANVVLNAGATYALVLYTHGASAVTVHGQFEPCGGGSQRYVESTGGLTWTSRTDRTIYYSVCVDFATPTRGSTWGTLKGRYR